MRGKTQLEQNKTKDRNANGRVDPFHMPTELADGLEAESLPRVQTTPISPCRTGSREGGRLDDAETSVFVPKTMFPRWILRAPGCGPGRLRRFKQVGL